MARPVKLTQKPFGVYTCEEGQDFKVTSFTWTNSKNTSVTVITFGATITSIKLPGLDGCLDDIVCGFDNIEGYRKENNPYFGATIGRCTNRIDEGKICIDGKCYQLSINKEPHHLHGGVKGWSKVNWDYNVQGNKIVLSYFSKDTQEGYPGDVVVNASFELNDYNEFLIEYVARTTKPTILNMTNHAYFNLAGHNKGAEEIYKHYVSIKAYAFTDARPDGIPSGKIICVKNTFFDLQSPTRLGDVINYLPDTPGFDHNFCISTSQDWDAVPVCRIKHPDSGRLLELFSNQPGLQFYTANEFPEGGCDCGDEPLQGKEGTKYTKHSAFSLEPQLYPDGINHDNFPTTVLYPGQEYRNTIVYKFTVKPECNCDNK